MGKVLVGVAIAVLMLWAIAAYEAWRLRRGTRSRAGSAPPAEPEERP